MKIKLGITLLTAALPAFADIDPSFRQNNAVSYYDFTETTGNILDKGRLIPIPGTNPVQYYPQVHLAPLVGGRTIIREAGAVTIDAPDVIQSLAPADKITRTCRANGAMSLEVWLENNESVLERSGFDSAQQNSQRPHPLRIVNLSQLSAGTVVNQNIGGSTVQLLSPENLYNRNFVFGQFYDEGNMYLTGIRTSSNESTTAARGRSLVEPLASKVTQTIVPDTAVGRTTPTLQKVVVTLGSSGIARLYLSDLNGNMYKAEEQTDGFRNTNDTGNLLRNWYDGAYLSLGNTAMTLDDFNRERNLEQRYSICTNCYNFKNRYWKGKLRLVAIYCQELTKEQVLGPNATANVLKNTASPIDLSMTITPERLRAQDIYNRLTGSKVPITDQRLTQMAAEIQNGNPVRAAEVATQDPRFFNVTVRDFAARMSNRDGTVNVPLNDFIATIIGAARDNVSAKDLLTEDILYIGDPAKAPIPTNISDDVLRSNNHYETLDRERFDLSKVLVRTTQKVFNGRVDEANPSPAGLLTSRQWLAEHAIAGTNRRLIEYAFKEFLCTPLENVADSTGPDNVIGPDIDRFPGGSHTKFTTTCRACHTILDGFRPAYSRWTFGNGFAKHAHIVPAIAADADENMGNGMQISAAQPGVSAKLNRNADVFPDGRRTTDEKWVNNAIYGANAVQFKFTQTQGNGVRDFGRTIASSPKYQRCLAERVFKQVCKRDHKITDNSFLDQVATEFANNSYNLKFLFQKIVVSDNCLGGQ